MDFGNGEATDVTYTKCEERKKCSTYRTRIKSVDDKERCKTGTDDRRNLFNTILHAGRSIRGGCLSSISSYPLNVCIPPVFTLSHVSSRPQSTPMYPKSTNSLVFI